MGRPAVFLDRDGTLVREVDYLRTAAQLRLLRGAADAIRRLNEAGLAVVLATNQSGIGRGLFTEAELQAVNDELQRRLAARGARLDAIYYCPHHPGAAVPIYRKRCRCRKPAPGLLLRAARDLDLDLSRSFAVGDSARDIEAGARAGCRTILVRTGYGARTEADLATAVRNVARLADQAIAMLDAEKVVADLPAAVGWILSQTKGRGRSR